MRSVMTEHTHTHTHTYTQIYRVYGESHSAIATWKQNISILSMTTPTMKISNKSFLTSSAEASYEMQASHIDSTPR